VKLSKGCCYTADCYTTLIFTTWCTRDLFVKHECLQGNSWQILYNNHTNQCHKRLSLLRYILISFSYRIFMLFQYFMHILTKFNTLSRSLKLILKFNTFSVLSIPCENPETILINNFHKFCKSTLWKQYCHSELYNILVFACRHLAPQLNNCSIHPIILQSSSNSFSHFLNLIFTAAHGFVVSCWPTIKQYTWN